MTERLPGNLLEEIADALSGSFTRDEFERLVRVSCTTQLDEISTASNYLSQVYDSVDWAHHRGLIESLLTESIERRPNSEAILKALAAYNTWQPTIANQPSASTVTSQSATPQPGNTQPERKNSPAPVNPASWDIPWTMLISAVVVGSISISFHNSSGCFTPFCQSGDEAAQWERIAMSYWAVLGLSLAFALAGAICYFYVSKQHWSSRPNEIPFPRFNRLEQDNRDPLLSKLIVGAILIIASFAFYSSSYKYSKSRVGVCEAGNIKSYGHSFISSRIETIGKPKYPLARTHMVKEMDCESGKLSQEYIWYLTDIIILIFIFVALVFWSLWFRLVRFKTTASKSHP